MTGDADFDLTTFLPYLLNQAAERLSLEFQQTYKVKYGMLRTEWRVLFHLGRYGEMTAKQICDRAGLHKTKVSRAVTALEKKRFLIRSEMAGDRRHSALALTKSGRAAFEDLCRDAQAFDAQIRASLPDGEAQLLERGLMRLAGLAQD
ncbi:MarR family transcriptional regulator [Aliishimia ponticola]|uniref:MarR family transcriptional regulator n=1 Tax=Aliishimia ponticola TaxID=2499833 RepID=A0A4S4N9C5_9RHOB|nr:MarR family winged helix-turn-helix transcriptional regulator [Aliishimia ponticola]THH35195.1 MarR family transcriptional regulator [Aliishimia ponticola]